jgi:hypothetical protein
MSSKGALGTGAAGRTPPATLRTTRSITKVNTQQPITTLQLATVEKKKAKAREAEMEARRILTEEECLSAEDTVTHHTLPHTLTSLAQKYDNSAPPNLIKAMRALALLATKIENPNGQFEPVVDAITQRLGKEVADWLRIPINEAAFTRHFDPDTIIRDRVHPIMVPRIPLTFDPSNPAHLREVEEVNRMGPKTIKKARWIKPEYRRAPEQSCAHAIFTISSVTDANHMIKDGIYVCNARSFPKKLKYEPKQCMKCRKWGHYAAECRAQSDTCGTCGGQHKTNECKTNNKKYCVSCRTDTHASWDRNCPEFLRKCDEYSKFHPENNLVYFPTDENWTTTSRPALIPFEERFPTRYTVGSLPMPNRAERQLPTRPIGKRNKRSNNNNDSSQAVLEKFFNKMIDEQPDQLDAPPPRADDDDNDDYYNTQIVSVQNTLPADFLQNHKA